MTFYLSNAVLFAALIIGLLYSPTVEARSTFASVRTVFDTYCTASCHTNTYPFGGLILEGSDADVYNALVMKEPSNSVASSKGDKLVMPGYPEKSFLLRKLNKSGWEDHPAFMLGANEGDPMPQGFYSLKDEEIELIRQWILFGCPDTGEVVDTAVLSDFYNGSGSARTKRPAAPLALEGFQIKYGPFFLAPHTEQEYFIKHALLNHNDIVVDHVDFFLHPIIHHFNVEKFIGNRGALFPEGFRAASVDTSGNSVSMVTATQFSQSMKLPEGSAYIWSENSILSISGHAANYYTDSVVAIEAYVNLYYDNPDAGVKRMFSTLVNPSFVVDSSLFFLPPGQEVTFTDSIVDPSSDAMIDIWMLTSHTHKYGTSYNIYERDVCGGKGDLLYNGNFNQDYTFDQGYFDFEHPSVRVFDQLHQIPIKQGLIHEATYFNHGIDTVYFGLTTEDEMMNVFMQYMLSPDLAPYEEIDCTEDTVVSEASISIDTDIELYPNPFNDVIVVSIPEYSGALVRYALFDMLGRLVLQGEQPYTGNDIVVNVPNTIEPGQYLIALRTKTGRSFRRFLQKQ